jgi:hypothetical protein
MTLAQLTRGGLSRARAVEDLCCRVENDVLVVEVPEAPEGASLAVLPPGGDGRWQLVRMEEDR